MEHDFYTSKSACKLDVDGSFVWCNQCTNWDHHGKMLTIEFGEPGECCTGFMDYGNHPEYWSICSVRDFEQHYVSQNWSECLPEGIFLFSINTYNLYIGHCITSLLTPLCVDEIF